MGQGALKYRLVALGAFPAELLYCHDVWLTVTLIEVHVGARAPNTGLDGISYRPRKTAVLVRGHGHCRSRPSLLSRIMSKAQSHQSPPIH